MTSHPHKTRDKKTRTSILAVLLATFLLLSNCATYAFTNTASAQTESTAVPAHKNGPCNCVIFRLDDTNSEYLSNVQLGILDTFISKNQSLSLGLIMHRINPASPIVEKIKEGKQKGLFELDIHGWDHVDYSQMSPDDQLGTLLQANSKLHVIFGQYSQVFIPPYNKFDGDTIGVLKPAGIRIFSADTSSDKAAYFVQNGKNTVRPSTTLYHLPAMATFKSDNGNGTWIKVPLPTLLAQIGSDVGRYGYSVVLLHPQNFAKMQNGMFVDTVDPNEIKDLSSLMDSINSRNMKISTFSGVTGLIPSHPTSSYVQTIPEFHGAEIIALLGSMLVLVGLGTVSRFRHTMGRP